VTLGELFGASPTHVARVSNIVAELYAAQVLQNGGIRLLTGNELRGRTPQFVQERHPSAEVHNTDITYFYLRKSTNADFQRLTFCNYKKKNLLKVGAITTCDGFFESMCFLSLFFKEPKRREKKSQKTMFSAHRCASRNLQRSGRLEKRRHGCFFPVCRMFGEASAFECRQRHEFRGTSREGSVLSCTNLSVLLLTPSNRSLKS